MPLAPSSLTYSTQPVFIHDFSNEEIDTLTSIVMSFGKVQYAQEDKAGSETESRVNTRITIESILKRYNWRQIPCADDSITYWSETGNSNAIAGCIQTTEGNNVFTYLGNTNTFCSGKSDTPFQVYTYLAHNRDQNRAITAAQSLFENIAIEGKVELELDENQINGVPVDSSNITYLDASEWLGRRIASPQPIIKDLLDFKDKCLLIGQAKTRKSFLALQLSCALATGSNILGYFITRPYRVALTNLELRPDVLHSRLESMTAALGIPQDRLKDRLFISNLRGVEITLENIEAAVQRINPEVLIIDPLYKVYGKERNENDASDATAFVSELDEIAQRIGCAIIIVHHDSKSGGGDNDDVTRGGGSGVFSRAYDSGIILTRHRNEQDGVIVVSHVLRNYQPRNDFVIRWGEGMFDEDPTLLPQKQTWRSHNNTQNKRESNAIIRENVFPWFLDVPSMPLADLKNRLQDELKMGKNSLDGFIQALCKKYGFQKERNESNKRSYDIIAPSNLIELLAAEAALEIQQPTT